MNMAAKGLVAGLITAALLYAGGANATVVNFDSLRNSEYGTPMPAVYGGIAWDPDWYYIDSDIPAYDPQSNPTRIYAATDENGFTFEAADRAFAGAWFSGYYYVWFNLYNDGSLVHTSGTLQLLGDGPAQFLGSGYAGQVDRVTVAGIAGAYVMDDVTYEGQLPEPGTAALLAAGLLMAGTASRRRRPAG